MGTTEEQTLRDILGVLYGTQGTKNLGLISDSANFEKRISALENTGILTKAHIWEIWMKVLTVVLTIVIPSVILLMAFYLKGRK